MSSESYTVRTAEPHEYSEVVEVLISAFDGDPAMMAIIGGKNRRKEMEKLRAIMTLQVYGNFKDRGRIDVAVDDSSGKIVGVCLWNNPESQEGSFLNEIKQISAYYRGLGPVTLVRAIMMELHLLKYRPSYQCWRSYAAAVSAASSSTTVPRVLKATRPTSKRRPTIALASTSVAASSPWGLSGVSFRRLTRSAWCIPQSAPRKSSPVPPVRPSATARS